MQLNREYLLPYRKKQNILFLKINMFRLHFHIHQVFVIKVKVGVFTCFILSKLNEERFFMIVCLKLIMSSTGGNEWARIYIDQWWLTMAMWAKLLTLETKWFVYSCHKVCFISFSRLLKVFKIDIFYLGIVALISK